MMTLELTKEEATLLFDYLKSGRVNPDVKNYGMIWDLLLKLAAT